MMPLLSRRSPARALRGTGRVGSRATAREIGRRRALNWCFFGGLFVVVVGKSEWAGWWGRARGALILTFLSARKSRVSSSVAAHSPCGALDLIGGCVELA